MKRDEDRLKIYRPQHDTDIELPMAESTVHAGFPSPADDFLEGSLDLDRLVVRHPEATFFARVEGDSMIGEGIAEGYDNCLAVAYVDGEFTLKRVRMLHDRILLVPANPRYPTIEIATGSDFAVWGVVSWIVKRA